MGILPFGPLIEKSSMKVPERNSAFCVVFNSFLMIAKNVKSSYVAFQSFKTSSLLSYACLQDETTRTSNNLDLPFNF